MVLKDLALFWTVKKMAITVEMARRILSASPQLVQCGFAEEGIEKLKYMMMMSGYNFVQGRPRYSILLSKVNSGEQPFKRSSL